MSTVVPDPKEVDAVCAQARQGDVIPMTWVAHFAPSGLTLGVGTDVAEVMPGTLLVSQVIESMAIVSQTCDIVEPCQTQPYLELAPVIKVTGDLAGLAAKGWVPRLVPLAAVDGDSFVDLTRLLRVEKTVLLGTEPQRGCPTSALASEFGLRVGHRFSRPAFPEDIVAALRPMTTRIRGKLGKLSDEGVRVGVLDDVRLLTDPDYWASPVTLFVYFVLPPEPLDIRFSAEEWDHQVDEWLDRCEPGERIGSLDGMPVRQDSMTATIWEASDSIIEADVLSIEKE